MGDRKRRRWQHYLRNPEEGGLKTALSAASAATFQAIRGKGDHINDYARLLVTEELLLTDGSTFTWEYFQPVQLVQQVLGKCSGIARLYAEKLRDNPPSPDKPWRVVLGCDEHTPGSKGEPAADGGADGDPTADGRAAGDPAAATADWLAAVDL